jgi:dTDP-4-amino-4,6-dideoxygalactose transaminase
MKRNIKPFDRPVYVTRPILPDIKEFSKRLKAICDSRLFTNIGAQHVLLEKELVRTLGVPNLSLFNNGTIALIAACQSLRLSGEAITTPFTFPATTHVLAWNNIKPVFCDIDPLTMNIDANKIESMITPNTTAILAVHVFGTPCNVSKIRQIADRYGLKVIYDAAHAFGSEINGKGIGNYGDISMFSFHATKLFHTAEGGALAVKTKRLKQRIDLIKNHGIKNEDQVVMPGINGKMSELQAALGLVILPYIDEEQKKRQRIAIAYGSLFKDVEGIKLPYMAKGVKNSLQYYVIRIDKNAFGKSRDFVHERLKRFNVFTRKYFHPLCSDYSCYKELPSASPSNLNVAQKISKEVLSLPFYGDLSLDDVERICSIIKGMRD